MTPRTRMAGFTLIEMIVVVAIVGILATAAQPLLSFTLRRTQEFTLRQSLRTLREAIDAHKRAADEGRIVVAADATGYPATLEVLVNGVADARNKDKRLYFLRRLPRDPFAEPAVPAAQTWNLRASDTPPEAPMAGRDVFDVHSRSEAVALDGSTYNGW
ncbi:MAG: hypothetical protein RLZZ618_3217 [Pseudomonadota bacterium]|jgi:general secretion pathway protein G